MLEQKSDQEFTETLDKQMLDLIIKSAFFMTLFLASITFPFGQHEYAASNLAVAFICGAFYILNRNGYFKLVFWLGTSLISLIMVYYTYRFGYINAHLYLLAGMVVLSYFSRRTKYASELIWAIAIGFFMLSHYFLRSAGKISQLTTLEEVLFYPNLFFSMLFLYMSTNLYKKRQESQRKQLQDSVILKDKLLSLLSHDLRTPFTNLVGITELLESGDISKNEFDMSIKDIKKSIGASQNMLDNVLFWITTQQSALKPEFTKVSLNKAIQENIELLTSTAELKGVQLIDESKEHLIESDVAMLNSILRNLISNAIKFSPKSTGKVQVSTRDTSKTVELVISDNGLGIPPEKLGELFNKLETKRGSENEVGFGLGLQLVDQLCKKLTIEISVDSKYKEWTKFTLSLPKTQK